MIKKDGTIIVKPVAPSDVSATGASFTSQEQAALLRCFDALVHTGRAGALEHLPDQCKAKDFAKAINWSLPVVKEAIRSEQLPGGYRKKWGRRAKRVYRVDKKKFLAAFDMTLGAENFRWKAKYWNQLAELRELLPAPEADSCEDDLGKLRRVYSIASTASKLIAWQGRLSQRAIDPLTLGIWLETLPPFCRVDDIAGLPAMKGRDYFYKRVHGDALPGAIRLNDNLKGGGVVIHRDTFIVGAALGALDEDLRDTLALALGEREEETIHEEVQARWCGGRWSRPRLLKSSSEHAEADDRSVFSLKEENEGYVLHLDSTKEVLRFQIERESFRQSVDVARSIPSLPLYGARTELQLGLDELLRACSEEFPMSTATDWSLKALARTGATTVLVAQQIVEWIEDHSIPLDPENVRIAGSGYRLPKMESVKKRALRCLWEKNLEEIEYVYRSVEVEDADNGKRLVSLAFENIERDGRRTVLRKSFAVSLPL